MAATGKVLGTVTSVVGEAKATAADGTVRVLQVGDVVHSDEVITTSAAGAINIALESGKTLDCGANTDLSLHESILGVATATAASPAAPGSVEALQQAIAAGQDPSQIAPATAAGGAPGAGGPGDGGGGTPVILEQANTSSVVTAGFPTQGGTITFPLPEFQLLPAEQEPPAVSVSVQVQVQVQVQVEVEVAIAGQPNLVSGPAQGGVFAVSASGDAVDLIEGTMEGTMTIPFVITLSQAFDTDVQVTYQIVPASASTPSDFFDGVLTATITIPAGQTSFTVPIQIVRDHVVEGNESFSIVLIDAVNATINPDNDSASVTIFNDDAPPVANNDANWAQEDTHITAAGNVLQDQPHSGAPTGSFADAADTDFEPLSVTNPGTYAGTYGTLVLNSNGSYTYTLNNGSAAVQALDTGETLTDSFGYSATDGFNTPDSATLTVTIFGTNDAPTVAADTNWAKEESNQTAAGNVLQDLAHAGAPSGSFADHADSDTDVEPLSASLVSSGTGSFGSLVLNSNGSYTYTLNNGNAAVQGLDDGETLTDTFTYAASDGTTSTNATLTITIFGSNDAPTVAADTNWAKEESNQTASGNVLQTIAHTGAPSGSFSDAADSDVDVEPLTASLVSSGAGSFGSLVLNSNGSYTYTLNNGNAAVQGLDEGETLTDTFTYAASDGTTSSNATLTITIFGSNDVPEIKVKTSEIFASGAEGTVNEAALANGSNPSSNAEFVNGSFQVSDTDGVDDLQSVTINGQTVAIGNLVGATFNGSAGTMTVTSYSGGIANFTYELKHAVTDVANQVETDVFTLTVSDGTSNSAPANVTITIIDDVPSTQVAATQSTDALTVDESDLETNATANFADAFNGSSSFGADGPGTVSDAIYSLSVNAGSTGLVDTATNQAVTLAMNGGAVEGRVSNGEGGFFVVFRVSVDASGNVTLDQQRAVVHTPDSGPDQSTSLASANLVVLTRTATITDADGDTANSSATISIGTALNFEDDAPSVNVSATQAADALTVDETSLATNATANFADNFSGSSAFGADGAGTLNSGVYSLSINDGATGLVDTATGESVTLQMSAGKVQGVISGNVVVFEVSVDASGTVTLDQQRAVMHTPNDGPDQSTSLAAANLVVLTRTDTITDKDGDSANSSASISIGAALSFKDDAPSVNVSATQAADTLTVDESDLPTNATANFADNFNASSSFGADGAGTAGSVYALSINAGSTGLVDTATNQAVTLQMSAGKVQGIISGNVVVFEVSVDASGTVTLDQQRAVMHTPNDGPDQSTSLASPNLVVLTRTDTITDKDGDSANSAVSINIGTALNFEDDAPSLDITGGDTSVIEGQSITNGTWTSASGADAPATTKVVIGVTEYNIDSAIDTGKGTLTVNSNGTWTFAAAPNQSNPQVVSFSVKITDRDGDIASDNHTITINDGANPAASGPQVMTVNEAALSDGSNPPSTAEVATAGLTFTSGSDAITSIVFGATGGITVTGLENVPVQSITWVSSNGGHTLTGSIGGTPVIQVVLSGDLSVAAGNNTGNVTATATLLDNMLHQDSPNGSSLVISGIQVVGQDSDGDTATHTFTGITVLDDVPSLSANNVAVANVEGTYTGTYAFTSGADTQSFADSFEAGSLVWTNPRDGYELEYDAGASSATQQVYHGTFNGGADTFFDIVVKSDGTYDVTLVTPDPVTEVDVASILSGIDGGSNLPSYTIGNEVFGGLFDLLLTGYSQGHQADTLTISATELGVGDNVMHGNKDDELRFDIQPLSGFVAVSSLTIHVATTAGWKATDTVDTTIHYTSGPDTTANVVWGVDRQIVVDFDTARTVDWVEIEPHGTDAFKIDGVSLSYLTKEFPDDYSLAFQLTGDDKDGDSATAAFSVQVNTTDTSTYEIQGTGGNDHVYGTTGDDSLTGQGGHDVFVFNSMADAADTVTDFHVGNTTNDANADVLDIGDILPAATQGATLESQLTGYVTLDTVTSPGNTIVKVDANGGGDGFQTLVTLNGVTGVTLQQLLDNHQLVT